MKSVKKLIVCTSFFLYFLLVAPLSATAQVVNIQPNISPPLDIGSLVSAVINLLFVVAAVIAMVFLIYGGIRWVISGGDKAAVESARNTIIAAIIGLVIVFLSYFILTTVFQFLGLPNISSFKLPNVTSPNLTP